MKKDPAAALRVVSPQSMFVHVFGTKWLPLVITGARS